MFLPFTRILHDPLSVISLIGGFVFTVVVVSVAAVVKVVVVTVVVDVGTAVAAIVYQSI